MLNLTLKRDLFYGNATLGRLFVGTDFECFTLEDRVRPDGVKVYGETAIPAGTYEIKVTWSPRFKRYLPLLLDVPNFQGVRIHPGNTHEDTEGCLLVGREIQGDTIIKSRAAFDVLYRKLKDAQDDGQIMKITITREA